MNKKAPISRVPRRDKNPYVESARTMTIDDIVSDAQAKLLNAGYITCYTYQINDKGEIVSFTISIVGSCD